MNGAGTGGGAAPGNSANGTNSNPGSAERAGGAPFIGVPLPRGAMPVKASDAARHTPEVMAVWEPMGPVLLELTICEVEPL